MWGIVRGNDQGWLSPEIVGRARALGRACSAAFVAWERRAPAPMLPLRLFRSRAFSATNGVSLIMNFGIFGSIFLLAQFLQTVQGYSAFDAGVRTLPWTLMPMFVAPLAGLYSDRIGSRPLMFTGTRIAGDRAGLARQRWPRRPSPTAASSPPSSWPGVGMALVFAPVSNMILSSVSRSDEGKASGANNAIREVGGALGVAVLASVFSREGNVLTGQGFVDGLVPAVWIGAAVLAAGALLALAVPGRRPERDAATEAAPRDPRARVGVRPQRIVSTKGALAAPASAGTRARSANWPACTIANEVAKLPEPSARTRPTRCQPVAVSASSTSSRPRNSARRPLTRATVGADAALRHARGGGAAAGGRAMRTSTRPGATASRTVAAPAHATRSVATPRAFARTRSVRTI